MELLKECYELTQEKVDAIPLMEMVEESIKKLSLQKNGGLIKMKDFYTANPGLVKGAAVMALSSTKHFKNNFRNTIKLHAKKPYEKRMMTTIVDALKDSGKFKLQRINFEGGGKTWVLKRK